MTEKVPMTRLPHRKLLSELTHAYADIFERGISHRQVSERTQAYGDYMDEALRRLRTSTAVERKLDGVTAHVPKPRLA